MHRPRNVTVFYSATKTGRVKLCQAPFNPTTDDRRGQKRQLA